MKSKAERQTIGPSVKGSQLSKTERIYFVVVLFQASKEIFIKVLIAEPKLNEQRIHQPHTPRNIVLCKNNLEKLLNRKLQAMLILSHYNT